MTDIASISLRVDTDELQRSNNELDKFQQKATGAAGAADGFNASGKETAKVTSELAKGTGDASRGVAALHDSMQRNAKASRENAASVKDGWQELHTLIGKINPGSKALAELEKITRDLAKANREYLTSNADAAASLATYNAVAEKGANVRQVVADAHNENAASTKRQSQELQELLNRINPTNKAFEELEKMTNQLSQANKKGLLGEDDFLAYNAILDDTRAKLQRTSDAMTVEGRALLEQEAASRKATTSQSAFIEKLREKNALYKASASDAAAYRAAQLGISQEAAPLIAQMQAQERALIRETDQKRAAAIASRGLKEALKEQEAAERSAAQAAEKEHSQRTAFIQKLKDQVATQSLSREELLRYRAAQLGVSSSADVYIKKIATASAETHKFSLQSGAARRELGVMIGELARGNLGALRGSSITLANRSGLIDQMMTLRGLGIASALGGITAAVYGLSKAWYQGSQESVEFNKQLILTGNYAGKTAAQLQDMAKAISGGGVTQYAAASVLAQVVGSGAFKASQLETVAKAAAVMEHATGQSVDATIKNFEKLYASPTKASEELNKQLHYLTSSQYEYISSLESRGYKEAAGEESAKLLSEAEQKRSKQLIDNLSGIDRLLKDVTDSWKGFWDAALNVGRSQSVASQLQAMEETLAEMQENDKGGILGRFKNNSMMVDRQQLETNIRLLRMTVALEGDVTAAQSKGKEADEARTKSLQYQNEILSKNQSWQQKRNAALTELWQMVAKAPKDWTEDKRKIAVAQINADNKPPTVKKGPQYHTPAGDKAEDSAQAELLALQSQLEVLRQHAGLNDKISQQRKDLWKAQAQFTVLEQAAGTRQLSAQEKSLLSSKDAVLANKERLAVLGDQVVQQERLNKLQDASTKYVIQMSEKRDALRESAGLSGRSAQRRTEEAQLRQGWQNQGGKLSDKGYQDQLQAMRDYYAEEDKLRGNWQAGVQHGWNEYLDSATNVYASMSNIAGSTLSGMADMLTNMVTTGKASFRSFTTSILTMIADVINKLLVAYMVQAAMGWISAGASAGAGSANNAFSGGAFSNLSFDSGGYTGPGGKYEHAGIVHKDEFVFHKEATQRLGVDYLYALMRGDKGVIERDQIRGYATGGLVSARTPSIPSVTVTQALPQSRDSQIPQVNVFIDTNNQQGEERTSVLSSVTKLMTEKLSTMFEHVSNIMSVKSSAYDMSSIMSSVYGAPSLSINNLSSAAYFNGGTRWDRGSSSSISSVRTAERPFNNTITGTAPMHGLRSSDGPQLTVNAPVTINQQGQQQTQSGNRDAVAKAYQQAIDTSIREGIARELKPSGLIWNAQNQR